MSVLYLYALATQPPAGPPGEGLAGEAIEAVSLGESLFALAGAHPARPSLSRENLAAHDATERRLAELLPALLPARFGETAPDEDALRQRLAPRAAELREALALVEGAVQMTLRVFSEEDLGGAVRETPQAKATEADSAEGLSLDADLGPGARYLAERRRLQEQRHSLPEVAVLREALRPYLRAERVERHPAAGRLLATAYDLVESGQLDAYRATVLQESAHLAGYRVAASGPWPPYAFAPEALP